MFSFVPFHSAFNKNNNKNIRFTFLSGSCQEVISYLYLGTWKIKFGHISKNTLFSFDSRRGKQVYHKKCKISKRAR